MIFGNIQNSDTYENLIQNDAISQAFTWIERMPRDQEPGIYELQGKEIFVNVHGYETLPRDECRFESHLRYVDLQYCIAGGELIDRARREALEVDIPYVEETDLMFHFPAADYSVLRMGPGDFALFWPEDAHRPKVHDGRHAEVKKLVVKIAAELIR